MNLPKKQGQRLIPEYLLKYNEELRQNHPDPSAEWGGGGSTEEEVPISNSTVYSQSRIAAFLANPAKYIFVYDNTVIKRYYKIFEIDSNYIILTPQHISGTKLYYFLITKSNGRVQELSTQFQEQSDWNQTNASAVDYIKNKPDLSIYELKSEAFSGDYNDLSNKPTIPTKTSDLTNDSGYITGVTWNDVTNKPTFATVATSGDYNDLSNKPTIPVVPTNISAFTNDAGYITGITSSDVTTALGYTPGTSNFSGNYNDLTNKPSIPTATSDLTNDSGFITANDIPTYTTLFSITPTSGTTTYTISLSDDITKYDEIKVYYNDNDDTVRRFCSIIPEPTVGNKITLTSYLNNSTPRLYTKNTVYLIATTTSLTVDSSVQQRISNNAATSVNYTTTEMHCRPYKIIGIKY